ncbi:MAG TPA: alpha/beta fold hydrolase [Acidimicrobiales bacterium]|nr:alpha/beta fold hydrolase [Acidimicrobiales bacterium]
MSNGIELEYDTFGSAEDPALLLIMGLGAQLTMWDEAFCNPLADEGFYVIRYDNRDVGLSTRTDGPVPDVLAAMGGDASSATYRVEDMADDGAGLLDALGINAAHVVGASMGGMIAQAFAIRHPDKTRSLCSIMSTTGDRTVGQPNPDAMGRLLGSPPSTREEAIANSLATGEVLSPFHFDATKAAERAGAAFDRAFYPTGMARQLVAILASADRTEALGNVTAPTLVIHGAVDPLVTISGGEATAKAVPGADLLILDEMGHDIPEPLVPGIVAAIAANARKAG